ncbi:hypothetical protein DWF00_16625 [Bosea caraganae]|uniref:Uncharacterized protein n=2 Tax=Bosea caraganae TaxID=2763117 RepID=A0A370KYR6_9HYPH|nr:hypothetical protein DWE98_26230 [Bosea caraganae]RDJ24846.1 hypothetical protein DWF00_16625 [Bosea caraganae]
MRRNHPDQTELQLEPRELYREQCEDAEGNRYTVIAWRPFPGLDLVEFTLDDGSPVKFVDDCLFQVAETGTFITRCP